MDLRKTMEKSKLIEYCEDIVEKADEKAKETEKIRQFHRRVFLPFTILWAAILIFHMFIGPEWLVVPTTTMTWAIGFYMFHFFLLTVHYFEAHLAFSNASTMGTVFKLMTEDIDEEQKKFLQGFGYKKDNQHTFPDPNWDEGCTKYLDK